MLHSLERVEPIMTDMDVWSVIEGRKDLYSLLGVESVADVERHGRLRWFRHLEVWMIGYGPLKMWWWQSGQEQGQEDFNRERWRVCER